MPAYANWNSIGLTYLLVLLLALFVLVILAIFYTWHRAPPLPESESSTSASDAKVEQVQLCAPLLPTVNAGDAPIQFNDDEELEISEDSDGEEEAIEGDTDERPLPISEFTTKSKSQFHKFVISTKLLPSLQDYVHPGFIVTYTNNCSNTQQAFQSLCTHFGSDLISNVSMHFETAHHFSFRGFHMRSLSTNMRERLLSHISVGDIHEDGWITLNLPQMQQESKTEKDVKLRKLQSLAHQQIVPWSVVRVGGKMSSLRIGGHVPEAEKKTSLDKIAVFVLDSGIDVGHPEIQQGIWSRNFVNVKDIADQNKVQDENGHGTHVAGIIGAVDNRVGTVGTCPSIPIHAVKVLDKHGIGSLQTILQGLAHCSRMQAEHPNVQCLVNMSFGTSEISLLLDHAVAKASETMTIVIAAGNERVDVGSTSPARTAIEHNTIAVGAFDQRNCFSSYSNFGQGVTVLAPGDNILSTFKNGSYAYLTGTSMAAPCVTGIIAAYLSTLSEQGKQNETPKSLKHKVTQWAMQATVQESQIISLRPSAYTTMRSVFMKF
jgi:hypothetical protein